MNGDHVRRANEEARNLLLTALTELGEPVPFHEVLTHALGTADWQVDVGQAYVAELVQAGLDATLQEVPGGHQVPYDPLMAELEALIP